MLRLRLGIGLTATFVPTRKGRLRGALRMDAGKNACARCANLAHLRIAGRFGLPLRWIALSRGATRLQPLDGLRRRRRDQPLCLDQAHAPEAGVLQSRVVRLRRTVREQPSAYSSLIVCVRQLPRCRRAQRLARRVLPMPQIARPIRHWTARQRRSHRLKQAGPAHRLRVDLGAHRCAINASGVATRLAKDLAVVCKWVPLADVDAGPEPLAVPCRPRPDAAAPEARQAVSGRARTMSGGNREPESPCPAAASAVVRRLTPPPAPPLAHRGRRTLPQLRTEHRPPATRSAGPVAARRLSSPARPRW